MENIFSHELVSVIKRACFARHSSTVRPTLLVVGETEHDPLLTDVLHELFFDSTLSTIILTEYDEGTLQRNLSIATIILLTSHVPRRASEQIFASQKPRLEWNFVKRDACPLFWPAHSVMDFFIVHQDSVVTTSSRTISQEGEEQ